MSLPSPQPIRILHLEDNLPDAAMIGATLATEWSDCEISRVDTREQFRNALLSNSFNLILSDFSMPGFDGHSALKLARQHAPQIPFVFLSGTIGEELAVESLKQGATDYVIKDRMSRLIPAVRRALSEVEEQKGRLQAEQRMREQAELLDKARDAIVVTGMDRRILYWNYGAERVFGWTAAEAIGRSGQQLFGPEAMREFKAIQVASTTGEWHGEINLRHKQGGIRVLKYSVTIIHDTDGRPKSRLIIGTDITAEKEMERQFLRAQRLESLGTLAAGIAHDLNNVLSPVLMSAPLLRRPAMTSADLRVIETIEKSAERGAALVRQILSFAHGANRKKTVIQVKHLLHEIAYLIKETFPKSIQLDEALDGGLWTILGDSTQIHQILLNLCVNARDAMPKGGTLTLRAANERIDQVDALVAPDIQPGNFVRIEVSDSGTGIAPEMMTKIWEPFFTTKGEGQGTGLGLATVRSIAVSHHGFVTVQSAPGQGTTFRVYLPSAERAPDTASSHPIGFSASSFVAPNRGEQILVVDDEIAIGELVKAILTSRGYSVLVANDGEEGVKILKERAGEITLLVTDINMPKLDGIGLARILPRYNPTTQILFMSGGITEIPSELATDPAGVMKKPFSVEELVRRVGDALAAGRRLGLAASSDH